ncbi:MAG: glycoside hydrolase family 2 TIM barrel-domain containing protein [Verrucomicrobiae bacterium]|nr:glycoside hydrolase family 2 TIM barrel-domain containing protein [Verrucomicrobiae bacterium]
MNAASPASSSLQTFSLNGKWKFKSFVPGQGMEKKVCAKDFPLNNWLDGNVPGSVQGSLCALGKLPDPFFNQNAMQYRFIEDLEWWYARDFDAPESILKRELFLNFDGVDTLSSIYLNGVELGKTRNMLTPYEFKAGHLIHAGRNRLAIRLDPIVKAARKKDTRGVIDLMNKYIKRKDDPALNWFAASYIRKANFAFGGDMSQRFLTVGIWRPVRLITRQTARILHPQIVTRLENNHQKANIILSFEIEKFARENTVLKLRLKITHGNNDIASSTLSLSAKKNKLTGKTSFAIQAPRLWWPNGMGEQNLYDLTMELFDANNRLIDVRNERFGLREVRLIQEKDPSDGGTTFTFAVNGAKVFAKGANWTPVDTLMDPVPKERYAKLVAMAKEANFNMFRINGFGIYEDDEFYAACDEAGIMIWHDFMFSDCMYPDDQKEFLEECRREGETIVRRLRNHPSIVLWCGNNEIDEIYYCSAFKHKAWKIWGEKIFHKVLPQVCKKLDSTRPYWPSSAWSAPGKFPLWDKMGDSHFYPTSGAGFQPTRHPYGRRIIRPISLENTSYRLYAKGRAKFYSEFGLAAVPSLENLEKTGDNLWPLKNNPFWEYHVAVSWPRPVEKFLKITNLLNGEFGKSRGLGDFIVLSQISQAATLKFAIEHFRSRKYSCSGALFWQYNDSWPTLSCSVVDYYLDKKIAWYWVKKAFAPLLLAFIETEKNHVDVMVVNDLPSSVAASVSLLKTNFQGITTMKEQKDVIIPANSKLKIRELELSRIKPGRKSEFLWAKLLVNGKLAAENRRFFALERDIPFPTCRLTAKIESISPKKHRLTVGTDVYARMVRIDMVKTKGTLSDNYFDLAPAEKREILIDVETSASFNPNSIAVSSLNSHP